MSNQYVHAEYALVSAVEVGPLVFAEQTLEAVAQTLMWCHVRGASSATSTLWKKWRGEWRPMFPWQHICADVSIEADLDEVPF